MVAWHEVPGIRKKKEPVPEGRCDCVFARQSSSPSGTDRFFLRLSWHFVPGYSHASLRDNKSPGNPN